MNDLNDKEKAVILAALDCYIRVHLAQIPAALEPLTAELFNPNEEQRDAYPGVCHVDPGHHPFWNLRCEAEELQEFITGSRFGSPGIHHPGVSNLARLALRLKTHLRIAWSKGPGNDGILDTINHDGEST